MGPYFNVFIISSTQYSCVAFILFINMYLLGTVLKCLGNVHYINVYLEIESFAFIQSSVQKAEKTPILIFHQDHLSELFQS